MSHFAKIDENNIVTEVLVISEESINTGDFGDPSRFIQTSYNTHAGVHSSGGTPLRKNYAGVGYTYDSVRDAFYAPQPYNSWILNEDTCIWESPTTLPNDGKSYIWDENTISWIEDSSSPE